MSVSWRWSAICLAAALAGCSTPPPTPAALPQSLSAATARDDEAPPRPQPLQLDEAAERLVALALQRSPELAKVEARLREAQAQAGVASARLWPGVELGASAGQGLGTPTDPAADAKGPRVRRTSTSASLSWELDLFGRNRQASRAAVLESDAAAADLAAARVTLANTVRAELVRYRAALRERALTDALLETLRASHAMESRRVQAGLVDATELSRLGAELRAREAGLAQQRAEQDSLPLRLRSLSDVPLDEIRAAAQAAEQPCSLDAPRSVPLQWLTGRRDVAAAQARLESAVAGARSARAALLPSFSLSASDERQRDRSRDLPALLMRSTQQFLGLQMAWSVLDGGQRRAEARAAEARSEAVAADYRLTVLRAAEETEAALQRHAALDQALRQQQEAALSAEQSWRRARIRVDAGLESRLAASPLEREYRERALSTHTTRRDQCLAAIDLNRALALSEAAVRP